MATKLDIFQQMCVECEVPIEETFNTQTETSRVFNVLYDREREALLSKYRWRFAQKRATLNQAVLDNDSQKYPWTYAFAQPSDYLEGSNYRLYYGTNIRAEGNPGTGARLRMIKDYSGFEDYNFYGYEKRGKLILSEVDTVDMQYTADVAVEDFSPICSKLLSLYVAFSASATLSGAGSVKDRIGREIILQMDDLNKEILPGDTYSPFEDDVGRYSTFDDIAYRYF